MHPKIATTKSSKASSGAGAGRVRPFVETDIDKVAELHRRVFRRGESLSAELVASYRRYFSDVVLNNPWADPKMPSLVYELLDNEIAGFIGVVPKPMLMGGEPIAAAVSSQFIVDPERRATTLAGIQLMRAFLDGPQDLSIADEANDSSRKLWEGLGGSTSLLYSVHWTRPLRPARLALSSLSKRKKLALLATLARPVAAFSDVIAARLPGSPFRLGPCEMSGEEASDDTLVACIHEHAAKLAVRPDYDASSFSWLLERCARRGHLGRLHRVLLRDPKGHVVGWYVYFAKRGGIGQVLHMAAKRGFAGAVMNHLSVEARRQSVVALTGRLEPDFLRALSSAYCMLQRGRYWMLIHSRKQDILAALHRGDAHLSRIEGEFCLRFS